MKFGMSIIRGIMVALVLGTIPVALNLPPEAFWELGPIENTEIAIFLIGTIMTFFWYIADTPKNPFRNVWLVGSLLFFLAAARETSWGRIFLASGIDENGPIVPSMKSLWFGPIIYVVIAVLILLILYLTIKNYLLIKCLALKVFRDKEAILYISTFILFFLLSQLVFEKDLIDAISDYHQHFEEMAEITSYWAAVALIYRARIISLNNK